MKPQSSAFLEKSHETLTKAHGMFGQWPDEAGRAAYLAGLQAAQALIFERTDRVSKTHEGVNSQFNLLTRDDAQIDDELRSFLGRTYILKAVADYEAGPGAKVPLERIEVALATATRFVDFVTTLLSSNGHA
jgi:uncharacterized protein (UPF0332 family)